MTAPRPEAPDDLVRAHRGLVLGVCRRMLGDAAQAEDVAQEVFHRFFRSGADHQARSVPAWLHTAAANACRDVLRHRRVQPTTVRLGDRPVEAPDPRTDPWAGLRGEVDEAMSRLDVADREVLARHFLQGETLASIGADHGVSAVAMHKRLHGALDRLRRVLRGMGCVGAAFAAAALTQAYAETGPVTTRGSDGPALGSCAGSSARWRMRLAGAGAVVTALAVVLTMIAVIERGRASAGPAAAVASAADAAVPPLLLIELVGHGRPLEPHLIVAGADGVRRDLGSFSFGAKEAVRARDGVIWAWTQVTHGAPARLLRLGGDGRSEIVALPRLTITALRAHPDGTLLIACGGRGQLLAWDPDGRRLTPLPRGADLLPWTEVSHDDPVTGGRPGRAHRSLIWPVDLTVAGDGTILVADGGAQQQPRIEGRIVRFTSDGVDLPPVPIPPGMCPVSIAVDRRGRVLVCTIQRELWRCDGMDGRDWTRFGPDDCDPVRVWVDRLGRVLVHDGRHRALISLGPSGDDAPVRLLPLTRTVSLALDLPTTEDRHR